LWRYPVKSMMGERVETVVVTERGTPRSTCEIQFCKGCEDSAN
jgi:hypothetical protein